MDVETRLRQFLAEMFILPEAAEELDANESFLANGIIDSTGVLELIFFAEDNFGITVHDHEVVPENFDSINRLVRYIEAKRQPVASQAAAGEG